MSQARPSNSLLGIINYAKPRSERIGLDPSGKGLAQGGEFMESRERGSKAALADLDPREMTIIDVRPDLASLDLDTQGFCVANLETSLPETLDVLLEEREIKIREIFWPEIVELARRTIVSDGRSPKYVFALGTQKFTEDKSRGLLGSYARAAHADFADVVFDRAHKMLTKRGVPEAEALNLDLMFVNTWKPFGRVVLDNPLAILDWTTLDASRDVHGLPRGSSVEKGNILVSTVTHNPSHRWIYLSNMTPDEVWFFKQADSRPARPGLSRHAFHTSFRQPGDEGAERTRRSIAVRLLCAFEPRKGPGLSTETDSGTSDPASTRGPSLAETANEGENV